MVRRVFCKLLLVVAVVLWAFSGVLLAQGNSNNGLARAIEVQQKYTDTLMTKAGIIGTAVGSGEGAQPVVLVLLEYGGVPGIPNSLDGVPVRPLVTGKIYALAKPGSGSASSTSSYWLQRPVPIGVSTGNANECAAGTISCRVVDGGGNVYALSNNHVYAQENSASIGEEVLQPGRYDTYDTSGTQCYYDSGNIIGTLDDYEPIVFSRHANNVIDAAIASTTTANLGTATPSDGYGTPSSVTNPAYLGQTVQKYGRTTDLTNGQVTGVNATILVNYGYGRTARFVNQIVITPGGFSAAGDSGSLIVDMSNNPVGLLFAGSSSDTIANPIGPVLSRFSVSIDDSSTSVPVQTTGFISGSVTNDNDGADVSGATVSTDTGQSTTTDSNGAYTLSNVPTGTHSVTASATGFQSQTITSVSVTDGETTTVKFSLIPVTTANKVSVDSITYSAQGGKTHDKNLSVTVTLVDDFGDPVAGASISVTLANSTTSQSWTASSTTGSSGTVTFTLNNAPSGYYTTTVTGVTATGLTWDGITPANSYDKS
jgi:hypothetical protein